MGSEGTRQQTARLGRRPGIEQGRGIGWVRQEGLDESRAPKSPPPIYAMIVTRHEGDIIESTVTNLLHQGVEAVYVLYSDSPDDTATRQRQPAPS